MVERAASLLLFVSLSVSLSSCASVANYVVTGRFEDPNAEEESAKAESASAKKSESDSSAGSGAESKPTKSAAAKPSEPALTPFPNEKVFVHGQWQFYRNSHGLFWWTGKDASLQLFAVDFDKYGSCWISRKADGPRVMHCPMGDIPLARDLSPATAGKDEKPSAASDVFNGFPNAPWQNKVEGSELPEGKYDLAQIPDSEYGTFSLEATGSTIKVRLPPAPDDERLFVIKKDSPEVLLAGSVVDLYDGCTRPDGTLLVYMGIGVKFAKKTCGILRSIDDEKATLAQDNLVIRFKTLSQPPDIAKVREGAEKLRQLAAKNKAQLQISVEGDAKYTIVSTVATKSTGEKLALVESDRIIGEETFRCDARFEGADTALLPAAKQICASMRAFK
jgi:hypothetical protein